MSMLATTPFEIGGYTYQVGFLAFIESRKAYVRLQKIMQLHGDEIMEQTQLGLFMFAGMAGLLTEEDLEYFCKAYGEVTSVNMGGNINLPLNTDTNRTTVFSGKFEDMFEWLDKCTTLNFGAVMGKLSGARKLLAAAVAEKQASESQAQSAKPRT